MTRILVVDDEPAILRAVGIALAAHDYDVEVAATAQQAIGKASGSSFALVILDLGLPDMDGLETLRQLLAVAPTVPIIVLSAWQDIDTRVAALDQGAADFVPKPFGMPELLARIRVALRSSARADTAPLEDALVVQGDLSIDTSRRQVTVRGLPVTLTRIQYQLLLYLARNPERVLTRRMIAEHVWGPEAHVEAENLRVVVSQLRRGIELDPSHPRFIVTEFGVGYRFVPSTELPPVDS
jgi:two-component system KDP operon response regulator KdpE